MERWVYLCLHNVDELGNAAKVQVYGIQVSCESTRRNDTG